MWFCLLAEKCRAEEAIGELWDMAMIKKALVDRERMSDAYGEMCNLNEKLCRASWAKITLVDKPP